MIRGIAPALLLAVALVLPSTARAERMLQGIPLPDAVHVADWDAFLRHAGAAIVYKRYLPFQVVALYVERGAIDETALREGRAACRLEVHWLTPPMQNVDVRAFWMDSLRAAIDDPVMRQRLETQLQRVADTLGVGARGQVTRVDYHPERGLTVTGPNGASSRFAGLVLTRGVLGLWLGPTAPADIRDGLLGRMPVPEPSLPSPTPSTY